jgi:hypothetical protein
MENVDFTKAVVDEVSQEEGGHDLEKVKEYVERLFNLEQEMIELRDQRKDLKEEYKKKVDLKLVGAIVRLVKAKLSIESSSETAEEIEEVVTDKINKIM